MEIQNEIRCYIVENILFGEEFRFKANESFQESGIFDSTSILEIILFLEENFAIQVADSDVVPENLDSLQNITDFVKRKIQQRTAVNMAP